MSWGEASAALYPFYFGMQHSMQNGGLARKHTQLFKMSLGSCIKGTSRSGIHKKFQDSENIENQYLFLCVCVIIAITTQQQQQKGGPYKKVLCIIYMFIFRFRLFSVVTELKPYISNLPGTREIIWHKSTFNAAALCNR